MARQGKIARLPLAVREELNARLLEGQAASKVLPWLNARSEVIAILEEDFEGIRVSDRNLSEWRLGGYQDWLRKRDGLERIREMSKWSVDLAKASGGNLTEGAAAILSGRILEVLEGLDELMGKVQEAGSDGKDGNDGKDRLVAMAGIIDSLTDSLASLRGGDQNNRKLGQNDKKLNLIEGRLKQTAKLVELETQKFMRTSAEFYLNLRVEEREKLNAIADGAGTNEERIERMGQALFPLHWKARTAGV